MAVSYSWSCHNCASRRAGQLYCSCNRTSAAGITAGTYASWIPLTYTTASVSTTLYYATPWTVTVTSGGNYDYTSWANPAPTPEQVAARRQREDALRAEYEQRQARRVTAIARAEELLLSVLSEVQARDYLHRRCFELRGSGGGWWRIRRDGQAGNVDELEQPGGARVASWCCHPPDGLPDPDAHLAQLLHLVTDEDGFRQTGNRTPRRRLPAGMAA